MSKKTQNTEEDMSGKRYDSQSGEVEKTSSDSGTLSILVKLVFLLLILLEIVFCVYVIVVKIDPALSISSSVSAIDKFLKYLPTLNGIIFIVLIPFVLIAFLIALYIITKMQRAPERDSDRKFDTDKAQDNEIPPTQVREVISNQPPNYTTTHNIFAGPTQFWGRERQEPEMVQNDASYAVNKDTESVKTQTTAHGDERKGKSALSDEEEDRLVEKFKKAAQGEKEASAHKSPAPLSEEEQDKLVDKFRKAAKEDYTQTLNSIKAKLDLEDEEEDLYKLKMKRPVADEEKLFQKFKKALPEDGGEDSSHDLRKDNSLNEKKDDEKRSQQSQYGQYGNMNDYTPRPYPVRDNSYSNNPYMQPGQNPYYANPHMQPGQPEHYYVNNPYVQGQNMQGAPYYANNPYPQGIPPNPYYAPYIQPGMPGMYQNPYNYYIQPPLSAQANPYMTPAMLGAMGAIMAMGQNAQPPPQPEPPKQAPPASAEKKTISDTLTKSGQQKTMKQQEERTQEEDDNFNAEAFILSDLDDMPDENEVALGPNARIINIPRVKKEIDPQEIFTEIEQLKAKRRVTGKMIMKVATKLEKLKRNTKFKDNVKVQTRVRKELNWCYERMGRIQYE